MNEITKLVEQVRLSTDFQINKQILREKIQTELHISFNGGMFLITTDLLAFLATWPNELLYLEDIFQNPIEIKRQEFLDRCRERYQAAMNSWHQQYAETRKIRKV